jgi:hypothetical protein
MRVLTDSVSANPQAKCALEAHFSFVLEWPSSAVRSRFSILPGASDAAHALRRARAADATDAAARHVAQLVGRQRVHRRLGFGGRGAGGGRRLHLGHREAPVDGR